MQTLGGYCMHSEGRELRGAVCITTRRDQLPLHTCELRAFVTSLQIIAVRWQIWYCQFRTMSILLNQPLFPTIKQNNIIKMSLAGQTQRPVNPQLYGSTWVGSPRVRTDGEIWGHSVPLDAQSIFFWRPLPVAYIKNNILGIKSLKIFF